MISIGKDKLILDTSNLTETDNVGAYLRDAAGNLLTSTLSGGKQALDVNMVNSLTVGTADQSTFTYGSSTELPIGGVFQDTGATLTAGQTGAVRLTAQRGMHMNLRDSSGNELLGQKTMAASIPVAIASDQSAITVAQATAANLNATVVQGTSPWVSNISQFGGSNVVTGTGASGAGIPRVTVSNDSNILATQSGTWTVQQGSAPWSVQGAVADDAADSGNPEKMGSRASFGAALSAISTTGDRADLLSDRYRRVLMSHASNVGALNQAVTVGTSAAALIATALNGRMNLLIQNLGSKAIYIGSSAAVTTVNGVRISAGADMTVEVGENVSLFAISGTAGQDVRLLELG